MTRTNVSISNQMSVKIKPVHSAILTLDDGRNIKVDRIGKGRFTTAWRNCDRVYAQTHEDDSGKEILSNLSPMRHIPNVKQVGVFDGPYRLYSMPFYTALTARSKAAWGQFKAIEQISSDAHRICVQRIPWDSNRKLLACDFNAQFLEMVESTPGIEASLVEALRALADECLDYGDYSIEIAKRNCAVGSEGELILLDPVFNLKELQDKWDAARRRAGGY